uniref:Uncharacterized protein n=1 Tax=Cacopsylla melanoneura TaxID=428564 RepID=A0A8D8QSF8_9HEMI
MEQLGKLKPSIHNLPIPTYKKKKKGGVFPLNFTDTYLLPSRYLILLRGLIVRTLSSIVQNITYPLSYSFMVDIDERVKMCHRQQTINISGSHLIAACNVLT